MAFEQPGVVWTIEAGADLSANKYHFAQVDADGQASIAGNGEESIGVIQDDNGDAAGKAITIMSTGITKVVAGATLAPGNIVGIDANGEAVVAATGDYAHGICLTDALITELASVLLTLNGDQVP